MLIMLEGPDGAGKTRLAQALMKALPGSVYKHHGAAPGFEARELCRDYMASMKPAFDNHLIMDRGWLSEPIYAEVYRKVPSRVCTVHRRMLERAALQLGGVVVLCLPPYEVCRSAFASGREEMLDSETQLKEVYDRYASRTFGHSTGLPLVIYDYTTDNVADLLDAIDTRLTRSCNLLATLIGERPATKNPQQSRFQVPFVSFTGLGCSEWLAEQLEQGGIREEHLQWFNAYDVDGRPLSATLVDPAIPVVALGARASGWCQQVGISHHVVPHPQYAKHFHYGKPYQLVSLLQEFMR